MAQDRQDVSRVDRRRGQDEANEAQSGEEEAKTRPRRAKIRPRQAKMRLRWGQDGPRMDYAGQVASA